MDKHTEQKTCIYLMFKYDMETWIKTAMFAITKPSGIPYGPARVCAHG